MQVKQCKEMSEKLNCGERIMSGFLLLTYLNSTFAIVNDKYTVTFKSL